MTGPLLEVRDLRKSFRLSAGRPGAPRQQVHAVDGVSFNLHPGEILGLVGESGCGKSTIAKLVLRLLEPDGGSVRFAGQELIGLPGRALTPLRREMQMIFQDPFSSLNPRLRIGQTVAEPLLVHGLASRRTVRAQTIELLQTVGLGAEHYDRYPHEFSGGQRQRISIARALILRPKFVVLDEPTSALDRTVQFQIVELLRRLQDRFGLTYMFITHDLALVRAMCHRVLIMKDGRIVEQGQTSAIFENPACEYTRDLLAAALE